MVELLKIGGNCLCVRAKAAHFVGHLPLNTGPICSTKPVLVLRKGTIVEWGTHQQLLARNGYYGEIKGV